MSEPNVNILGIIVFLTMAGLIPFFVVTMTGFLKIAVVMFLIRNALGVQQAPPNLVLYGIALVLTVYVTAPVFAQIYGALSDPSLDYRSAAGWEEAMSRARAPAHDYLLRFTREQERQFFLAATSNIWPEGSRAE